MEAIALFFLATVAVGGVAWVFLYPALSGERKAEQRMQSVAKTEPLARVARGSQKSRRDDIESTLKEILRPLEPFLDRTLVLHGVCDKVRGDARINLDILERLGYAVDSLDPGAEDLPVYVTAFAGDANMIVDALFGTGLRGELSGEFRSLIETINGERAAHSPYLSALRTSFDVSVDYRDVVVYRKVR